MIPYIALYLFIINLISYIIMYRDKQKAIKLEWRTPERTLWLTAIIGGSIGIWLAMKRFRHKTKHISFKLGIPIVFIIQLTAMIYFLQKMS
jgi:uncharacterized membrane protein YsdA (DUF1294 family)